MALENDTPADIADTGAVTIDNATGAAVTPPVQQAPADEPYDPADFYADDKPKGEAPAADADAGVDPDADPDAPAADADTAPIDAPLSWAKDAKEVFATLPREAQEIIATRERDRETSLQAKFREAAGTRQAVETEARTALATIMQNHQQALGQYAQMFQVPQPDLNLLNSEDPAERTLYFQQEAQYRHATAQREQLTQQMQEARQHAEAIQLHQQQAELQAEHQVLEEKLGTEWSDPSARAKLLGDLTPIAAELGYPQELIAQARACDIIAMRGVAALKAKADKWDAYNKAKMVPVRNGKTNQIPPTSRPNAPNGSRAPVSVEAQMYPDDVRRN